MTNILFSYMHRDEGNYKDHLEAVIENPNNIPLNEIEKRIKDTLIDGEFFHHDQIGLPRSEYAESGHWHEFVSIEQCNPILSTVQFPLMTVEALLDNFESAKKGREKLKTRQIGPFVPKRLAVSWLEFLGEMRQDVETITNACKGNKTVMVFNDGDWEILSETLELDAHSGNFDKDLRKDILRALDRAFTIEVAPMRELRRKVRRLEDKTQKELGKNKALNDVKP